MNITERIKSFEDACKILGVDPKNLPTTDNSNKEEFKSIIAEYKLAVITKALNEGWEPDWGDCSQDKYFNFYYLSVTDGSNIIYLSGKKKYYTTFCFGYCIDPSLCFKNKKLAVYARKAFKTLYDDYYYSILD